MVEYNLAKVNVEGSNPFFCLNGPKGSIWYFQFLNQITGNNSRIDICDYRLIGKSFIFHVNIMGSNPINHIIKTEKWLSG